MATSKRFYQTHKISEIFSSYILAYIFSYTQGIFYLYFTSAMNSKKSYRIW